MFGKFFGGSKKNRKDDKNSKKEDDSTPIPPKKSTDTSKSKKGNNLLSGLTRGKSTEANKASKSTKKPSTTSKSKESTPIETITKLEEKAEGEYKFYQRKKKGSKPKLKKQNRQTVVRKVGKAQRSKDQFFPGNVDFIAPSPKENWMAGLGQNSSSGITDFGDEVRLQI